MEGEKALNFLDCLEKDIPKGAWSSRTDQSGLEVTLANQNWVGFVAYARCNTRCFGFAYFGDGRSTRDFVFTH